MSSDDRTAGPRVRFRRVDGSLSDLTVEPDAHAAPNHLIEPPLLPVYEVVGLSDEPAESAQRTNCPDQLLMAAGLTRWQASHIIHRADWLWAHRNPAWVDTALVPGVDDEPAQLEGGFAYGMRIRVVCGHPNRPVEDHSLHTVLMMATRSAALYEIEHDHGRVIRTTNPYRYLVTHGLDPIREAGVIIDGATWEWHAGEYR